MSIRDKLVHGWFGRLAREAMLYHPVIFGPKERVTIEEGAVVNDALLNVSSGTIHIERDAFFGHGVSLLTGTHDANVIGPARKHAIPREGRDIVVGEAAWIASNVTVLGPCRIGAHAVVAAGSLVNADVPDYTVVAGVPARPLRTLQP